MVVPQSFREGSEVDGQQDQNEDLETQIEDATAILQK
jgi:hypothetical protein